MPSDRNRVGQNYGVILDSSLSLTSFSHSISKYCNSVLISYPKYAHFFPSSCYHTDACQPHLSPGWPQKVLLKSHCIFTLVPFPPSYQCDIFKVYIWEYNFHAGAFTAIRIRVQLLSCPKGSMWPRTLHAHLLSPPVSSFCSLWLFPCPLGASTHSCLADFHQVNPST